MSYCGVFRAKAYSIMIVCSLVLNGCAGMQQPVKETKVDFSQFAGQWEGEYESTATGRSGKVYLDLTSTAANAKGGIIMHPHPKESPSQSKITYAESKKQKAIPLSIDFVEAEEGKIHGVVTPYHDPHFNSTMFTTFEGTLEGNMMKGTFTVKIGDSGNSYTGTWWGAKK
ncbi:MAG: hypothetical protein ACRERU_05490 [Methylococcales bacterium]